MFLSLTVALLAPATDANAYARVYPKRIVSKEGFRLRFKAPRGAPREDDPHRAADYQLQVSRQPRRSTKRCTDGVTSTYDIDLPREGTFDRLIFPRYGARRKVWCRGLYRGRVEYNAWNPNSCDVGGCDISKKVLGRFQLRIGSGRVREQYRPVKKRHCGLYRRTCRRKHGIADAVR